MTERSIPVKRLIPILLVLSLLLALTACGTPSELSFTNKLDTEIHNVYINSSDEMEWADSISSSKISSGSTIHFDFEKIGDGPGVYDIGVIDENAMNYDAYEVPLAVGDNISVLGTADEASVIITHEDGTTTTYDAYIYASGE